MLVREIILLFCHHRCQCRSSPRPRKVQDEKLDNPARQTSSLARRSDFGKMKLKSRVHLPEHLVNRRCSPLPGWSGRNAVKMRVKASGQAIPTAVSSRRNPRSAPCIWETVFVVATHPESDRASTRVQLFSATRGKDFCRAVFPSLRSGGLVHLHRRVQAVGSGCCRYQQRRRLGRLSEQQLPAEDAALPPSFGCGPTKQLQRSFGSFPLIQVNSDAIEIIK